MGNSTATARQNANEEKDRVDSLIEALENKIRAFELEIEANRGDEAAEDSGEIKGGRSAVRISEVRVSTATGVDNDLTGAIENFFQAATNSLEGDDDAAKLSAVEGAKNLVSAGLSALFGTSAGQGSTRRSFFVLFLNNAFCRVDIYAYSYNVNAKIWGAESSISGACYIADLSVLKTELLMPSEIDFFLSQALSIQNGELASLNRLKIALVQSAILSRALKKEDLTFNELATIAEELAKSQEKISEAFNEFDDYVSPLSKDPPPAPLVPPPQFNEPPPPAFVIANPTNPIFKLPLQETKNGTAVRVNTESRVVSVEEGEISERDI